MTPTIILLNVEGIVTMTECLNLNPNNNNNNNHNNTIELLPIMSHNTGLWNCSKFEPFM